jgi:hypothetical protein
MSRKSRPVPKVPSSPTRRMGHRRCTARTSKLSARLRIAATAKTLPHSRSCQKMKAVNSTRVVTPGRRGLNREK